MPERTPFPQVGAPDPELKNSPVVEELPESLEELSMEPPEPLCYFNGKAYRHGQHVCSGSELLRCERGIWVSEGSCDPDNP
ncbi:MAG: hypothetical protein D6819_00510 [Gammaproteobacteria bacterium]|nr:MAG: hypothetical protein D6819_00510 [Gammaproteobacteria bacterium]